MMRGDGTETITREQAIFLLRPLEDDSNECLMDYLTGVDLMCKEYGEDEDWVGVNHSDYETIRDYTEYKTFQLWM